CNRATTQLKARLKTRPGYGSGGLLNASGPFGALCALACSKLTTRRVCTLGIVESCAFPAPLLSRSYVLIMGPATARPCAGRMAHGAASPLAGPFAHMWCVVTTAQAHYPVTAPVSQTGGHPP